MKISFTKPGERKLRNATHLFKTVIRLNLFIMLIRMNSKHHYENNTHVSMSLKKIK